MKAIFIILALMVGPKLCPADDRNLGLSQTAATDNVQTIAAVQYARSADGRLRQIIVNADGTASLGSITSGYTALTNVAASWSTITATTYNLTSTAGDAGPIEVWVNAAQGGAAIRYWFHPSVASAPAAALLASYGSYMAATTTVQITGRWVAGTHLSIIGVGAAATTGTLSLVK